MPQDKDAILSEDFITVGYIYYWILDFTKGIIPLNRNLFRLLTFLFLSEVISHINFRFEIAVIPKSVVIYETLNPGAIVRLWARMTGGVWNLLYEEPPETIKLSVARKFTPKLNKMNGTIK